MVWREVVVVVEVEEHHLAPSSTAGSYPCPLVIYAGGLLEVRITSLRDCSVFSKVVIQNWL